MKFPAAVLLIHGALLAPMGAPVARAADYYVDGANAQASDSNPGSESLPWLTVQKAADTAIAGDTVHVKPGVYHETVRLKHSGSAEKPIRFTSVRKHGAVIDGTGTSDTAVVNWGIHEGKDHIVWEGFEIRNGARYGLWVEGSHNTVSNCKVHDNGTPGGVGHTGIECVRAPFLTITGNESHHAGWNGISLGPGCHDATVEFNYSHDNSHHVGINLMPASDPEQPPMIGNVIRNNITCRNRVGIYMRWQQDSLVANNVIFGNSQHGITITYHPRIGARSYRAGTRIYNNTIVGNALHGINNEAGTHLTVKNNILAGNEKADIHIAGTVTTGHDIDYNLYDGGVGFDWGKRPCSSLVEWQSASGQDAHAIEGAPGFVDAAGNDYSITAASPAVDTGLDLTNEGVLDDFQRTSRPQGRGFDIGAFEPLLCPP